MYEIVKKIKDVLIIGNGNDFFIMREMKDGSYIRAAGGGMELQTNNLDYAAIGARKCKTLRTAVKWAKEKADR